MSRVPTPRTFTATLVTVGPARRLAEAKLAHERLGGRVRGILISTGTDASPPIRTEGELTVVDGLRPEYVNNAVASLRLSSLPTLVWWRGGPEDLLGGLADLSDRLILDEEDPASVWALAKSLTERTAVSDLRWPALTRWRALTAHFFDVPAVREAAETFRRLEIEAADVYAARLFAAWLVGSLSGGERLTVEIRAASGRVPLQRVRLGERPGLELVLTPSGTCIRTAVEVRGHAGATRMASLGEQSVGAWLEEEMRIRSRDEAFERALQLVERIA